MSARMKSCLSLLFVSSLLPLSGQVMANTYDDLWEHAKLYENSAGDYLNLSGRLQADLVYFDASEGDFDDALWRRFRFGFKGKYGHTTYHLEGDFDLNTSLGDSYSRLTDAYLSWELPNLGKLKVLKQSAGFTLDGKTSSKELLTPQRNNLSNNLWFTAEYFTGASLSGPINEQWYFNTGLFSSDDSDEIGVSDASYFGLISIGKKLTSGRYWDKADIRADFVYNDTHEDQNTRDFSQVISLNSRLTWQQWGLSTDIAFGNGDAGQRDLYGLVLMPFYQLTPVVQWVARYTFIDSQGSNGIRLGRYDNEIVSGRGDRYNEIYGGVNFFFYGHKAKIQLGAQYSTTANLQDSPGEHDHDGWGVSLALRGFW